MGHPSEYFIKYSLAQAWADADESVTSSTINDSLKLFGLPYLPDKDYDRIKALFTPPEGFRFYNERHAETERFMKEEKIFTLWKPTSEDQRVVSELLSGSPLVKHDLHILLMGRLPHEIVAQKLNVKYKINPALTSRMIDTYYHYFWNVSNASHEEWSELLGGHYASDALWASLLCGEQQALYRAGFSPAVDGSRALKEAFRQAYFRLEYLRHQPDSKNTQSSYSTLTAKIINLYELLYAQGGGLQEQLKQFRQIMMKHNDPDIPAIDTIIDKVAGGSYSGDGEAENSRGVQPSEEGDQDE